jgi:hypothetical protein
MDQKSVEKLVSMNAPRQAAFSKLGMGCFYLAVFGITFFAINRKSTSNLGGSTSVAPAPTNQQSLFEQSRATAFPAASLPDQTGPVGMVHNTDLQAVAVMVNLPGARGPLGVVSKLPVTPEVARANWSRAVQQAQRLMTGMCDCDQVNWLGQFITCGNYYLNNDPKFQEAYDVLQTVQY